MCQHGTNIPGYWPEEPNQMGLFSYHTRLAGQTRGQDDTLEDKQEDRRTQGHTERQEDTLQNRMTH